MYLTTLCSSTLKRIRNHTFKGIYCRTIDTVSNLVFWSHQVNKLEPLGYCLHFATITKPSCLHLNDRLNFLVILAHHDVLLSTQFQQPKHRSNFRSLRTCLRFCRLVLLPLPMDSCSNTSSLQPDAK